MKLAFGYRLILIAIVLVVAQIYPLCVTAQQSREWSTPVLMSAEDQVTARLEVAVDPAGKLHAVWNAVDRTDDPDPKYPLIMYSVYDGSAWSPPSNIAYYSPGLSDSRILADAAGRLHVFWRGDCLEYANMDPADAGDARKWMSAWKCIGDAPLVGVRFGAAVDSALTLYVAYGVQDGSLLLLKSEDNGETWQAPITVTVADEYPARFVSFTDLVVDSLGNLHITWLEVPATGYLATGLYYARSTDKGATWSTKVRLDDKNPAEHRLAISADGQQVHVVWNRGVGVGGRYHRWSSDGGQTWSELERFINAPGGYTGTPGAVVDSARRLHVLVTTDKGTVYTVWDQTGWSSLKWVTPNMADQSENLAIVNGNQLHALWRETGPIKHIMRTLDVPYEASSNKPYIYSRPFTPTPPPPVLSPTPDASCCGARATPTATVVRAFDRQTIDAQPANEGAPWRPAVTGIVSCLLTIAVVVVTSRLRRGGV